MIDYIYFVKTFLELNLAIFAIIVFLASILEGLGVPFPSEVWLALIGLYSNGDPIIYIFLLFITTIANLIGAILAYFIGRLIKRETLIRYSKFFLMKQDTMRKLLIWFDKYGYLTVFLSRMIMGIRATFGYFAGIARLDLKKYILLTFLGQLIFNKIFSLPFFFLSKNINIYNFNIVLNEYTIYPLILSIFLLVFLISFFTYTYKRMISNL